MEARNLCAFCPICDGMIYVRSMSPDWPLDREDRQTIAALAADGLTLKTISTTEVHSHKFGCQEKLCRRKQNP